MSLVLTRKVGTAVHIGDDIRVTVVASRGNNIRLKFEVPDGVAVWREEIYREIHPEKRDRLALRGKSIIQSIREGRDLGSTRERGLGVCPGCGCYRDKCACDYREAAADDARGNR